ncbi:MAG: carboxy terminal-processing peptidase [Candidatus Kapabacteria bacterium]|nr:carboxy terminal-processing peptidase [Candidatus Kapabacteria bacterium]
MKFKALIITSLIAIFFLLCSLSDSNIDKKNHIISNLIHQSSGEVHYAPIDMNDSISNAFFDLYLERIDYSKRFLLKEDITTMNQYRNLLDDEYMRGTMNFFQMSVEILESRTKEAENFYEDLLDDPFDYKKDETYETDPEKRDFAADETELKEIWRKALKLEILARIANQIEIQEKAEEDKDTSVTVKTFDELEEESREKVRKRYEDWFHRLNKYDLADRFSTYINALTTIYDSHTEYFPPKDKEDFDIRMSGQLEGIGAVLQQRDEYITVSKIMPGSPSWKQGELKAKDKILKVAQGDEDPVDVVDMRLDKAVQLIRGKKGTEVRLTIKKIDGAVKVISIIRDIVNISETYAKSVIIENKDGSKVGYIMLPSFYLDMRHNGGRRCASDIRKEIIKLKKQKVDRMILDLRNNGGGSLQDVVEMAGFFIEQGPIVQVKSRFRATEVLRDRNPSILYDGPLVVMVNSNSASASEIFAAAMQDYGRAVIVGSPSTFGKGTVQRFFDLDRVLNPKDDDLKPLGQIKMTIQKFYRINGSSTQLKGVVPDIILPDYYKYIDVGEKETDSPLPWDEVASSMYTKWGKDLHLAELRNNNIARISNDSTFLLIDESAKRLKKVRDNSMRFLNSSKYFDEKEAFKKAAEKFEIIGKDSLGMEIYSIPFDVAAMEGDTTKTALREEWLGNLNKDYYLFETVKIVNELSGFKK